MTSRERVEAALRHEEPDRTPVFEYVLLSPVADALLGRPYAVDASHWPAVLDALGWERAVRQQAIDSLDLACLLGHDMMYVCPNPMPARPRIGIEAPPAEIIDDPVAALIKRNEDARATPAAPPDESLLIYAFLAEEMARRGVDLPVLAPAYAHGVWTDVDLMQTMLIAPDVAHDHFELATRTAFGRIDKYVALGVDQIGVGGDFAGTRPLIAPESYRAFIMPEVRACSRRVHEAGRWAVNASDGDLWSVIDDFLIGCEVDGYLEIDLFAGMDLARLKQAYGGRIALYGNLDCGNMLTFGTPDEIRQATIRCLEAGQGAGGHILCASNAITASVSVDNYLAVVHAYRDYFGLPRIVLP
ncbi:MAG TPA: uroporphyrinogen decarboxylase family protein [Candidatus Hydrogenedentes bacterium]|nr:uroporphyrinogen decarboxylase family protein [Candidatus Hydrogenedentota bacterium]HPG65661.1 uroporphyrinogen decarboxylase family protein [Candidatus Hydrogenedentota bacterium]